VKVANLSILDRPSRGGLFFTKRHPICQATSIDNYGSDHTSLRPERIVAFFHLGTLGRSSSLFGVLFLWYVAGAVLGFLALLLGLVGLAFEKSVAMKQR
jgi:hypothetical protein